MKFDFAIAAMSNDGKKRMKEGDVVAYKPHPGKWGKKEVKQFVIVTIDGLTEEEALECIACELQFLCLADPSSFDPVSSESPLHFAGHAHERSLRKCLADLKK